MTSDELGRQRAENGHHRMVFQDAPLLFPRPAADKQGAFLSDREARFAQAPAAELPRGLYSPPGQPYRRWNSDGDSGSEEDNGVDDDDLDEDDDGLAVADVKDSNNSSCSVQSSSDKIHGGESRGGMAKNEQQGHEQIGSYENAIPVVEPESYCPQAFRGGHMLALVQKEVGGENGYGFGGRKDLGSSVDPGESVRAHLSDPVTGVLMDDAVILRCGHSYSSSGMQHIYRMKTCYKCAQPISEDSARPNLSLRSAVQAFRREDESHSARASKRRRDKFEQEKNDFDDPFPMDSRGKGVQFPFVVSDRVIIKGNKRTPERFVGRVAVVTTQCLNGWYVVKTLDNAESVKLQYRSLAKVSDDSSSNVLTNKSLLPNWL